MDNPDFVIRVIPPMTTVPKAIPEQVNNQPPTHFRTRGESRSISLERVADVRSLMGAIGLCLQHTVDNCIALEHSILDMIQLYGS